MTMKDHPITSNYSPRNNSHFLFVNLHFVTKEFLRNLTGKAIKVYLALCAHRSNKNDICYPTRRKLVEETGLNKSTVTRGIRELETFGLIESWIRGRKKFYRINGIDESQQSNRHIKSDLSHSNRVGNGDPIGSGMATFMDGKSDPSIITTLNKTTLNKTNRNIMDEDSFKKGIELLFNRIK